ncbi:putative membrane protein [Bacillus sp. 153480037-1]
MNEYFKKKKWEIIIFLVGFIILYISSYLLIGGPKTIEGPISIFIAFCLVQFLKYRQFKKDRKKH